MAKYDVSICQPALRPAYWTKFYESFKAACTKYTWELVLVAPHEPPPEVAKQENVKFIKEYCSSCTATMIGAEHCEGELIAVLSDEGTAFPSSLDRAIDLYKENDPHDVIILRYREGENFKCKEFPMEYWYARSHPVLKEFRIPKGWMHMMQYLISLEYFKEIGGYDCRFEHVAMAGHDIAYRAQRNGSKCYPSPGEVMHLDWFPGDKGDHAPVSACQPDDFQLFREIYTSPDVSSRTKIPFDNWKDAPRVWPRRWPNGIPE